MTSWSLRTLCILLAASLVSSCTHPPSELHSSEPDMALPYTAEDYFGTLTRAVYGNPLDVDDANDDRLRRGNNHLNAALRAFRERFNFTLPPWAAGFGKSAQQNARRAVTLIAAILTILSDPERFQDANGSYTEYPDVEPFITSQGSEVDTFLYYRSHFAQYLSAIYPLDKVGTGGDYDFVLGPLINLLYSLKDTTHYISGDPALTNDMIFDILCQNSDACLQDNQPFHSFRVGNWDLIANPQALVYHPETENHVLMILTWNFLATSWVMWQGYFPSFSNPRYSTDMISMRQDNIAKWMEIRDSMQDLLLKVLGRIVHRGLFETNARPYQHYALLPIFLLANYATVSVDPDVPEYTSKVKQAAQNAFHYIATKLTFQSLKQKRIAPMRRSYEYRYSMSPYSNNQLVRMFGLLTGTYDYDDCHEDSSQCMYNFTEQGASSQVMPFTQSDYLLPSVIHGFFVDKPQPFFARMQAQYYRDDYELGAILFPDLADPAAYIEPAGGKFKGTPELYFGTGDLLLTAGGMHKNFYHRDAFDWGKLQTYHFWAKPTTLMFRGDYGQGSVWNPSDQGDLKMVANMSNVADDVLLMRGRQWKWPESTCNIWVYKSFAYGYRYHDKWWVANRKWHLGWPQDYPDWWDYHIEEEFKIGDSNFRIFSFDADVLGEPSVPYYIIMTKLRKEAAKWPHNRAFWEYQRGFVEIVPRWMYPSSAGLRSTLETMNPDSHFGSQDKNESYKYVMATTFERITLDARMATNANQNHECVHGIREIAYYDPVSGDWFPFSEAQLKHIFLPSAVGKGAFLEYIPLITVWELNDSFQHTGRLYVETLDRGTFVVRRPETVCLNWSYLTYPPRCTSWGPGWQCLKVDSSDYANPRQDYKEVAGYHDCYIP